MERLIDLVKAHQWHELVQSKPLAAALGFVSHIILANGEPDYKMHLLLPLWFGVFSGMTYLVYAQDEHVASVQEAFALTAGSAGAYFGAMFSSMIIYRVFFHRLRKFPGPLLSRITKFYSVWLVLPTNQYFWQVEKLHKKYGDYVRTGPRELSVADTNAVPVIHGLTSKCTKSVWYATARHIEGTSLHTTRNKQDHKERRRIWDRAFNTKSLREYEPRIERHTAALLHQFRDRLNETIDLSNWLNFYSFDVMGDIGFSRSFGMMEKGQEDKVITALHASMAPMAIFSHIAWAIHLILRMPRGADDLKEFMSWTSNILQERKKLTPKENDIFSWLINPEDEDIPRNLNADTRLVIVAGSDTTASTLTWLFYEFCKDPSQQKKMQKIIDDLAGDRAFLNCDSLVNVPHLDGCINEALRLHPAVPSGVQRETPPEGITVGDRHIPGNTIIWMPIHTMQRDARYFPEPLAFMPERWTDRPEMIQDKRAFMPFSVGTYNCIGQKLAMIEMRAVTANILRNFDMAFAPGEDGREINEKTKDTFTLTMGHLKVVLTSRRHAKA